MNTGHWARGPNTERSREPHSQPSKAESQTWAAPCGMPVACLCARGSPVWACDAPRGAPVARPLVLAPCNVPWCAVPGGGPGPDVVLQALPYHRALPRPHHGRRLGPLNQPGYTSSIRVFMVSRWPAFFRILAGNRRWRQRGVGEGREGGGLQGGERDKKREEAGTSEARADAGGCTRLISPGRRALGQLGGNRSRDHRNRSVCWDGP